MPDVWVWLCVDVCECVDVCVCVDVCECVDFCEYVGVWVDKCGWRYKLQPISSPIFLFFYCLILSLPFLSSCHYLWEIHNYLSIIYFFFCIIVFIIASFPALFSFLSMFQYIPQHLPVFVIILFSSFLSLLSCFTSLFAFNPISFSSFATFLSIQVFFLSFPTSSNICFRQMPLSLSLSLSHSPSLSSVSNL